MKTEYRQDKGHMGHKSSNKSNAPKWVKVSTLPRPVDVRPANEVEKAGLKKIVDSIIDKMLVCEEGIHKGEFIAPHRTDTGRWNNILTHLHRETALEHVRQGVFRGL